MTTIGYARVSTSDQDLTIQVVELKAAGCSMVRSEKESGATRDGRSELQTVLDFLRPGDVLAVVRLDRLGRDTRDVLNIVHDIETKGASLKVLHPAIDTSGPTGKIVLTVLGMVAQMERQFIKERQRAGIEAAKAKGVYRGRKAKIDLTAVQRLKSEGKGMTEIGRLFGVTCQSALNWDPGSACKRDPLYVV
jgi:DNA invertase Pin-like site-specific DNA recombinase